MYESLEAGVDLPALDREVLAHWAATDPFGRSLIRSTYLIHAPNGTVTASERNVAVALFRRLVGFVPVIGDFADWLPIPYHFTFERDGRELGVHKRRFGKIRDIYDIDMSADAGRTFDRRLVLAAAVGMDALQAR